MKTLFISLALLFPFTFSPVYSKSKNAPTLDEIKGLLEQTSRPLYSSANKHSKLFVLEHDNELFDLKARYNDEVKRVEIIKTEYDRKNPSESTQKGFLYSKLQTTFHYIDEELVSVRSMYVYISPLHYFSNRKEVSTGFPIKQQVVTTIVSDKEIVKEANKYYKLFLEQKNDVKQVEDNITSTRLTRSFQSAEDENYVRNLDSLFVKKNTIMKGSENDKFTFQDEGQVYYMSTKYYKTTDNAFVRVLREDYKRDYCYFYQKGQLVKGWQSHFFSLGSRYFWKSKSIDTPIAQSKDSTLDISIDFDKVDKYYALSEEHKKSIFENMASEKITEKIWLKDKNEAIAKAKKEGKLILVDFMGSDWCGMCLKQRKEIFNTPDFQEYAINNLVLLELDYPKRTTQEPKLKEQNQKIKETFKVNAFPTVLLLDHTMSTSNTYIKYVGYPRLDVQQYIASIDEKVKNYNSSKK